MKLSVKLCLGILALYAGAALFGEIQYRVARAKDATPAYNRVNLEARYLPPMSRAPAPVETVEYKVVSGDSLTKISRRNGCTVQDLRDLNALQSDELRIGQVLKVPVRK